MVNTMEKSLGVGRGGGRRFSMPQSGFVDKDEEQLQSKSSKVRVYDKISETGKISPLVKIAELENTIKNLQQPLTEEVRQRSDMIQQSKLTELSLKKHNKMLQKELENTKCLLAKKNQTAEESSVENGRLKKQVEELRKKNGELRETHAKILQEKEEQKMEFESVHLDLQVQISSLSASQMFLEDQTNSLQSEMDRRTLAYDEEKVLLKGIVSELKTSLDSLNKDLESSRAMEYEKQGQIVDLQDQLASLSAAKMLLEEETKSLQSEMDRRISVLEEEKVNLKGILRDLEIARGSLNKDLESSRTMEEERQGQIVDLQDKLSFLASAKMSLEEQTNSLQSELERTLVVEEENVNLKGKLIELEIALNSLNKDLESSKAMGKEKEGRIVDLRNHLSDSAKAKTCLEQKNNSLVTEMNKCTEENVVLQGKIREFEFDLNCMQKDLEYKDVRLRELTEKVESDLLENGKLKKDLESKTVRLGELTEKAESHLLENEKLKKDLESKNARLGELTEKVESNLVENEKLKKDIESKDVRLRELTEKVESHLLENEKLKNDIESKDVRLRELTEKVESHFLENGKLKNDIESKDVLLRELTEKVESHLLENEKLKNDIESNDVRLRELTEKVESHLLENGKLKNDIESKDVRLRELTEKVESHLLENGKLKRDLESKNIRLGELTESHLLENEKLRKDIESKDVRLRELTEKMDSQLLENGKQKCVHQSENEKANGMQKKPKANGEIERKTAQAKSMSEKRTARQLLKDGTTPKQVTGREMPWRL